MSKRKEAIRLIHAELVDIGGLLRGLQVAIGEFHHDVEGKHERRDQEVARLKERTGLVEGRLGSVESAIRKYAPSR